MSTIENAITDFKVHIASQYCHGRNALCIYTITPYIKIFNSIIPWNYLIKKLRELNSWILKLVCQLFVRNIHNTPCERLSVLDSTDNVWWSDEGCSVPDDVLILDDDGDVLVVGVVGKQVTWEKMNKNRNHICMLDEYLNKQYWSPRQLIMLSKTNPATYIDDFYTYHVWNKYISNPTQF